MRYDKWENLPDKGNYHEVKANGVVAYFDYKDYPEALELARSLGLRFYLTHWVDCEGYPQTAVTYC